MKTRSGKKRWKTKAAANLVTYTGAASVEEAIIRVVELARDSARALGFVEGVSRAPYDPWPLAAALRAKKFRERSLGFDGRIMRRREGLTVEVDRSVATRRRRRFTLAHEVGHLALWHASGGRVTKTTSRGSSGQSEIETLCNRIASEILAPWREVLQHVSDASIEEDLFVVADARIDEPNRTPSVLNAILRLSNTFDVSVQFSAVRVKEVCPQKSSVALVRVSEKRVLWSVEGSPGEEFIDALFGSISNTEQQGRGSYWPRASDARAMRHFNWCRVGNGLVLAVVFR